MAKLKENILFLTLKEPYFTQIKQGIKKYEYRNITDYFIKKLSKKYDFILFQNGYTKQSKRLLVEFLGVEKHIKKQYLKIKHHTKNKSYKTYYTIIGRLKALN